MRKIIFGVIMIAIFLCGCFSTKNIYSYFQEPEEIVIYDNGKEKTINKSDDKFIEILEANNKRFESQLVAYKVTLDEKTLSEMKKKELLIEFVYPKKIKTKLKHDSKEYDKIIIPLTGDLKSLVFYGENSDDFGSGYGPLLSPDEVIKLIK